MLIENFYRDAFEQFKDRFDDEKMCTSRVLALKKWKFQNKGRTLIFKCHCGGDQAQRIDRINHGRLLTVYQCRQCRDQISLTARTIFEGKRTDTPFRYWFHLIYLIALLDGDIPYAFIKSRYRDDIEKENLISLIQLYRIAEKIQKKVFRDDREKKKCIEMIGELRYPNFSKWFKSERRKDWKIGIDIYVDESDKAAEKNVRCKSVEPYGATKAARVFRLFNNENVKSNEWLLAVRLEEDTVRVVGWLHVTFVERVDEQKAGKYSYMAIQMKEKEHLYVRPFKLTDGFKEALCQSLFSIGVKALLDDVHNNVFSPSKELLATVDAAIREDVRRV